MIGNFNHKQICNQIDKQKHFFLLFFLMNKKYFGPEKNCMQK